MKLSPRGPVVTRADIERGLRQLDLPAIVEVHSSLSAFGWVEGGAEAVVDALVAVFSTVMVPSFTYEAFAPVPKGVFIERNGLERGSRLPDEGRLTFHGDMPVSREIGIIPETLRRRTGAVRSSHPTESFAAIGHGTRELVATQTIDDPLAPIRALTDAGGWILMVGADLAGCTPIHLAESVAGRRLFIRWSMARDGTVFPVRVSGCSRGFGALEPVVAPIAREAKIGNARVRAYPAGEFVRLVANAIRRNGEITMCASRCARCVDVVAGGPITRA